MYPAEIRKRAEDLRRSGKTYGEIIKAVGLPIPKSTLSDWCNAIELSGLEQVRLQARQLQNSERGRFIAHAITRKRRQEYLASVRQRVVHLPKLLKNKDIAKIALGMLYLGEGSKNPRKARAEFGNSDPAIISLYLELLRDCYTLDNSKFRCTVLCRADQNLVALEEFWQGVTKIPKSQFYSTRIDPRTVGKPSRKPEYKGVCVVMYLSADLYHEFMSIGRVITAGL